MARVLVYYTNPDIKKKVLGLVSLLDGNDFFFLSDVSDFKEDIRLISPECLIIEGEIFDVLIGEPTYFTLINSIGNLIIIGKTKRSVILPSGLSPLLLPSDFDAKALANAIMPLDRINSEMHEKISKDEKREIIGLVGISRDVTIAKEYEEKILQEQNLLKALMDNIPDSIYFKDRKSRFIKINKAWARKHNPVNPEDAIGKSDIDFFSKTFSEETFREEQMMMETALPLINKLEKKVYADGSERYKLVTKVPVSGAKGTIIGLVGISHDITDLKIGEIKLAKEKELLQSLMDNIPDLIYFKDCESKFTRINKAQAALLGMKSPDEAIGKNDFDFFPREQSENDYQDEQKILRSGIPMINHIEKVTLVDGNSIWISATKIPIKDQHGNISGLVGISRDITIMEEAREKLKLAKEKAEESNFAKSQFLANMSHEIRTPMNGVIGMADILSYTELTTEQQSYLDIIIKSGTNLLSIINDILDLSKIEADSLELEKAPINVRGIMEDVADVLIISANNKNL